MTERTGVADTSAGPSGEVGNNTSAGTYDVLTDRELRVLGEAAAGCSEPQVVTRDGDTLRVGPDAGRAGRVLFQIKSEREPKFRDAPDQVWVTKGTRKLEVVPKFDALFWSASACEKFVLSYYNSLRLLTPQGMKELRDKIYHKDTLAIAHEFKSANTHLTGDDLIDSLQRLDKNLLEKDHEQPWVPIRGLLR